jgi:hypothetical protein
MASPGPHSEPAPDFTTRGPLIYETSQPWFRLYDTDYDPLYFGRQHRNRFDAPNGEYGVLYVAENEACAFIETFGQSTGINVVTTSSLSTAGLAIVQPGRTLRLVDLASTGGLARIGADGRLCSGEHGVAQRWSKAIRAHPCSPDGILYRARHDQALTACAIYDTAAGALSVNKAGTLIDPINRNLLARILDTYQFALIVDKPLP